MNPKKPLVVLCSNTPFDDNPLGAKPLAISLSKICDVLYVDPPLSYLTALKQPALRKSLFHKRLSSITPSLWRLIPVVFPGKDRPGIYKITSLLLRKKIRRAIKKCGHIDNDVVIIATAPHYRVFLENTFNIYWMMDDYSSQPELTGIASGVLAQGQKELAQTSDINVCVSDFLLDTLDTSSDKNIVIYNGADADAFIFPTPRNKTLPPHILSRLPEKFALYVGGINDRIDLSYLEEVARTHEIVIAGTIDRRMDATAFHSLCDNKNVTYLGTIDNASIPLLMNKACVGLVPYADTTFNRSSMPLKIPEYLLCGLPVVSSALDFVTAFSSDDAYGESSPQAFAQRVGEIFDSPPWPSQRAMRSSRIAQEWSWDKKAQEFLDVLS